MGGFYVLYSVLKLPVERGEKLRLILCLSLHFSEHVYPTGVSASFVAEHHHNEKDENEIAVSLGARTCAVYDKGGVKMYIVMVYKNVSHH